ncbi:MAG: alkaline phosphatase D family protein [Parvularculaceae bacterium]|nr:alkaline phosphatase D family protein [Parvularculaceae bacterium]
MSKITRRNAIAASIAGSAAACARPARRRSYEAAGRHADALFAHGVASGDPGADSVVLWTRVSTNDAAPVMVRFEVSPDENFATIAATGEIEARPDNDFTAKTLANGLRPGEKYYYRFLAGDAASPVGRTRTLPDAGVEMAKFAVVSCTNFPFGYFNVYDLIARENDLDAVIHLGDYIYEYGGEPGEYGAAEGEKIGRPHAPTHKLRSLGDYRTRHAQYKSDPSSQAVHAAHPFIAIWDDHETANDSWSGGADNHDPAKDGDWESRKRAALQAYYEWMPIREPQWAPAREAIFRSFSFGDLLTVVALESRLFARSKNFVYNEIVPTLTSAQAVADFKEKVLWSPDRELLGARQLDFVRNALKASSEAGQAWRLIANQVTMAKVTAPNLEPHMTEEDLAALEAQWDQARAFVKFSTLGLPINLDAWDGFPAARERFYDAVRQSADCDGIVVVTGDTHTWWANDLVASDGEHIGVELGGHSVTSPSPYRKEFLGGKGAEYALLTGRDNKDVRYISGENHGYIALTVTRKNMEASFVAVNTIESPHYEAFEQSAFTIAKSGGKAEFASVRGLSLKERAVF